MWDVHVEATRLLEPNQDLDVALSLPNHTLVKDVKQNLLDLDSVSVDELWHIFFDLKCDIHHSSFHVLIANFYELLHALSDMYLIDFWGKLVFGNIVDLAEVHDFEPHFLDLVEGVFDDDLALVIDVQI